MATNYPSALDTTTELPNTRADGTASATNHAQDHNNLSDAVRAIEAELGTDPSSASFATVKARLDAIGVALAGGQAGFYAPWRGVASGTVTPSANRALLARFVAARDATITLLAFDVATASGTDDPVDVAIYDASLSRLRSSGATTGKLNSTGVKTVSLSSSLALTAGTVYYAALASSGSAAAFRGVAFNATTGAQLFGSAVPAVEAIVKDTSYPLPASITSPAGASVVPLFAVRES